MWRCCKLGVDFFLKNIVASCLAAAALGIILAFVANDLVISCIFFPRNVFLRVLQLFTYQVMVTHIIGGLSTLSFDTSPKRATCATVYFVFTTVMSVTLGLILVLLFKPGVASTAGPVVELTLNGFLDFVINLVPASLLYACSQHYKTEDQDSAIEPSSSHGGNTTELHSVGGYVRGTNTLGLAVVCLITGLFIRMKKEKLKLLVDILSALKKVTKIMFNRALRFLPVGVLFLTTFDVAGVQDWGIILHLGKFMAFAVFGLIIHGALVLPMIYLLCTRRSPWAVIKGAFPALWAALRTLSSSATSPFNVQCYEERNRITQRISSFMPIGTSCNMNGTVLYEVMAAIFITQLNNVSLTLSEIFGIGVTAAFCSTGTAGLPETGAVTTLFVLTAVHLPVKYTSLLVFVEWLLNHCNTIVNVLGDCIGMAIVHQVSRNNDEPQSSSALSQ